MPNRILREGIIESERINELTPEAELFYRRLMSKVDDYGRFHGHPALVLAACYPLQLDRISQAKILEWMAECADGHIALILLYEVAGKKYLQINNFGQRERTDSKFPAPCAQNVREMLAQCPRDDGHAAAPARARSESESESESYAKAETGAAVSALNGIELHGCPSAGFDDWWKIWSATRTTNHRMNAEQVYPRVVTSATEADCFACTRSYCDGNDPSGGYNPEKFLLEQARDHFKARWPPRTAHKPPGKQPSLTDRTKALWADRIAKGERPI